MPHATPEFADIYAIDPLIIISGDAHSAKRRSAVVDVRVDYVKALGRSTTDRPSNSVASPVDRDCKLDKPGVYAERWKHSVSTKSFANPALCTYYGTLKEVDAASLRSYWEGLVGGLS
jgi:hypothetical protein